MGGGQQRTPHYGPAGGVPNPEIRLARVASECGLDCNEAPHSMRAPSGPGPLDGGQEMWALGWTLGFSQICSPHLVQYHPRGLWMLTCLVQEYPGGHGSSSSHNSTLKGVRILHTCVWYIHFFVPRGFEDTSYIDVQCAEVRHRLTWDFVCQPPRLKQDHRPTWDFAWHALDSQVVIDQHAISFVGIRKIESAIWSMTIF
jgi:hypothetical protein